METTKFDPDLKAIAQRATIIPFGRVEKLEIPEVTPTPFVIYNTMQNLLMEEEESGIYRPSAAMQMSMTKLARSEFSVRITNIPIQVTQIQLVETLLQKIKSQNPDSLILRPFTRVNLVFDKEKKISRGLAYVNCETLEQAKNVAKAVKDIVIDACVLGAEILE